jgi:hypothetical protein
MRMPVRGSAIPGEDSHETNQSRHRYERAGRLIVGVAVAGLLSGCAPSAAALSIGGIRQESEAPTANDSTGQADVVVSERGTISIMVGEHGAGGPRTVADLQSGCDRSVGGPAPARIARSGADRA